MKTSRLASQQFLRGLTIVTLLMGIATAAMAEEKPGANLPDPTKPFGVTAAHSGGRVAAASAPVYLLQAIIRRGEQRKALINGAWVTENQTVAGARVGKIGEKTVTLILSGHVRQLSLQPAIIRRAAESSEQ